MAVPAGFGPSDFPSGIQLIGHSPHEFEVLQLAHTYEQVSKSELAVMPALLSL